VFVVEGFFQKECTQVFSQTLGVCMFKQQQAQSINYNSKQLTILIRKTIKKSKEHKRYD
jgi:hypothetical protein